MQVPSAFWTLLSKWNCGCPTVDQSGHFYWPILPGRSSSSAVPIVCITIPVRTPWSLCCCIPECHISLCYASIVVLALSLLGYMCDMMPPGRALVSYLQFWGGFHAGMTVLWSFITDHHWKHHNLYQGFCCLDKIKHSWGCANNWVQYDLIHYKYHKLSACVGWLVVWLS